MAAIVALTTAVYWQVINGAFVWDDVVCLKDQSWMLKAGAWKDFFAHDYCGIPNYFRPLASALLMLELRLFNADPAPMHLVSLGIHLINCLLVWRLAVSMRFSNRASSTLLPCLAMLLYALHPALIEPIAWISAQTELTVNAFMLLALLANAAIASSVARASAVSICFLLAACCKESAVALPFAIAVFDWMRTEPSSHRDRSVDQLRALIRQHWPTYVGIAAAGVALPCTTLHPARLSSAQP